MNTIKNRPVRSIHQVKQVLSVQALPYTTQQKKTPTQLKIISL